MRLKYIILSCLSVLMAVSCAKEDKSPHFSIEATLEGVSSPQAQFVSFTPPVALIDTVPIKEGQFYYEGESEDLKAITIYLENNSVWVTAWVKNGDEVKISGDIHYPELMTIEGGEINDQLSRFKTDNKDLIKKRLDMEEQLKQSKEEGLQVDSIDDIYLEIVKASYSLKNKAVDFIEENPESIASLVLLQDYVLDIETPEKLKEYIELISRQAKEDPLYIVLNNAIVRLASTYAGMPAPDFKVVDRGKDILTLDSFKEDYLLINFSVVEKDSTLNYFENLVSLYEKTPKLPLNVLTISLETEHLDMDKLPRGAKRKWFNAVENDGWNSSIVALYNITEITDNYLLDKNRSIIAHNISPDSIKTIVQKK